MVEVNSERWLDLRNLRGEVWKKVNSDPSQGEYYISNYGRLKRMPFYGGRYHFPEMIFRAHLNRKRGYYKVRVANRMFYVHQLVAKAFVYNAFNRKIVDHRNGDRLDNRARNLRWVTAKQNANNPITVWDRRNRFGFAVGERPKPIRTQVNLKKVI